ncbi:hypothetical protein [Deinococcus radiopugnans]|uniref:AbiV family abortive infection protein n=2 Tax=Deinococcus radiopugnans TaxID=57497 RepID=A0A5C4Y5S7_9DEIO|nr:hypothetical protein [Deinococcus radiopugnans]MBB6015160.1 hypothetical protein [Deinococcus radiopugnans ATCC 19172]TNM70884.1 hypothetical protein FHR04_10350 [Deinococcus radiopugnans ATCC 19172]
MSDVLRILPNENPDGNAFVASTLIFSRLMQDLRCVHLCALRGYPSAAGTVAASIWELSYEIRFLILNPHNAERWFNHRDIKHTESTHYNRFNEVMKTLFPEDIERKFASDVEWNNYSYLCAFKHGNSMFQQILNIRENGENAEISPNPDLSCFSIESLSRILYHSCNYCILSAKFIANEYCSEDERSHLSIKLEKLQHDLKNCIDAVLPKSAEDI